MPFDINREEIHVEDTVVRVQYVAGLPSQMEANRYWSGVVGRNPDFSKKYIVTEVVGHNTIHLEGINPGVTSSNFRLVSSPPTIKKLTLRIIREYNKCLV